MPQASTFLACGTSPLMKTRNLPTVVMTRDGRLRGNAAANAFSMVCFACVKVIPAAFNFPKTFSWIE